MTTHAMLGKIDSLMMKLRMTNTSGGHYRIVLETRMKPESGLLFVENVPEDVPVLFLKNTRRELCSFWVVRKVYEINCHKSKEQLVAAYNNTGWMSPDLVNTLIRVVNDCQVCQKFQK